MNKKKRHINNDILIGIYLSLVLLFLLVNLISKVNDMTIHDTTQMTVQVDESSQTITFTALIDSIGDFDWKQNKKSIYEYYKDKNGEKVTVNKTTYSLPFNSKYVKYSCDIKD